MRRKKQPEYYGGRIRGLVETVVSMVSTNPAYTTNLEYLHTTLSVNLEGYGKPETCFNCKRSMKITVYKADVMNGLLILGMAKAVRENIRKGMPFTEANKVHLPTLDVTNGVLKQMTIADYLGLIKQPEALRNTGYWILTTWAWKLLRGETIPASVKYWEGHLIGRSDEQITLPQMFQVHKDLVERAIARRKSVRSDHRTEIGDYDPKDWAEFGGFIQEQIV